MSIPKIIDTVKIFFQDLLGKNANVIGVEKTENGWIVSVECIEESEYMRSRALDDIVGFYEVKLDDNYQIIGYLRTSMRERDKIQAQDEE